MARSSSKRYSFEPDYAVPPGETLQETIDSLGMTQRDLAARTGLTPKTINEIIQGKAPITHDTAILLERVTGVPARLWNNLEAIFREQRAKIADEERLRQDVAWLEKMPYRELMRRGVIPKIKEKALILKNVLEFFGMASKDQWEENWLSPQVAYRRSKKFETAPEAVATWLRLGEVQARELATGPFDPTRFIDALKRIRSLTAASPEVFQSEMVGRCAAAGVAVVLIPEMKKCPVSGLTRWLTKDKAMIQLSLRYKTNDQFWFSFFHEAGHILKDGKKEVFIHDGEEDDDRETNANRFAADFLIPPSERKHLGALKTEDEVVRFAKRVGIAPGIVVGRMQKEGLLQWGSPFNKLKERFEWKQREDGEA
jgi:addiction module HigA family antidote